MPVGFSNTASNRTYSTPRSTTSATGNNYLRAERRGNYIYYYDTSGRLVRQVYSPSASSTRNVAQSVSPAGAGNTTYGSAGQVGNDPRTGAVVSNTGASAMPRTTPAGTTSVADISMYPTGTGAGLSAATVPGLGTGTTGGTGGVFGQLPENLGEAYGHTANIPVTDVKRGLEYPMRILQQVSGQDLAANPVFANFMSGIVENINNPLLRLALLPASYGAGDSLTGHDEYNMAANMIANMLTPGGGLPSAGNVLGNIATALQNPQSGIHSFLMGAGGEGMEAYGAQMDALAQMLQPVLNLSMSPLQQLVTNSMLNNAFGSYLLNVGDNTEMPLDFIMRYLGYPTQTAPIPGPQMLGGS